MKKRLNRIGAIVLIVIGIIGALLSISIGVSLSDTGIADSVDVVLVILTLICTITSLITIIHGILSICHFYTPSTPNPPLEQPLSPKTSLLNRFQSKIPLKVAKVIGTICSSVTIIILVLFAVSVLDLTFRHDWADATCTEPKTCTRCGKTEGTALGHTWKDATCTEPKTCSVCGATTGKPLGHVYKDWTVTKEPTCTEKGEKKSNCTRCGYEDVEEVELAAHQPGDWEVVKEATLDAQGTRIQKCKVCGATVKTEPYSLSPEESKAAYKAACKSYSYDSIARDPEKYKGTKATYTGKVVQVIEGDGYNQYRVNITRGSYGIYKDTIYVSYLPSSDESRILENDIITIYGTNSGTISYETVMGATLTIPSVIAVYIDVH